MADSELARSRWLEFGVQYMDLGPSAVISESESEEMGWLRKRKPSGVYMWRSKSARGESRTASQFPHGDQLRDWASEVVRRIDLKGEMEVGR